MKRLADAGSMLGQRLRLRNLRRWPNIEPASPARVPCVESGALQPIPIYSAIGRREQTRLLYIHNKYFFEIQIRVLTDINTTGKIFMRVAAYIVFT